MTQSSGGRSPLGIPTKIVGLALAAAMLSAPVGMSFSKTEAADAAPADASEKRVLEAAFELAVDENAVVLETGEGAQQRNSAIGLYAAPLATMPAFRPISTHSTHYGAAVRCMTQAIYYEAANEPSRGQRAVAQVVLNRLRHPAFPSSVCGVVYQGWNARVCQFSFTCDGSLRRTPSTAGWRRAETVAREALAGRTEASVGTATHYHADYVVPRWAYTLGKVNTIGTHIFYRFPGRVGETRSFRSAWSGYERLPQIDLDDFVDEDLGETDDALVVDGIGPVPPTDPTDRRAANDIGGRLDTSRGWQLEIPDPTVASARYREASAAQAGQDSGTAE